ncbi:hypothetical protein AMQ83_08660 [Paenibacillus riograndensis]|nr:hypothetical protein AMQ83_08660 [Paenibacillus riograndensis]
MRIDKTVTYCDEWSGIKKKAWHVFDEEKAYLHHQQHQPYTAVLTDEGQPKYIINITSKWVSVSFYDHFVRKYLNYDFEVVEEAKLFLRTAIHWNYEHDTDKKLSTMIFGFKETGYIAMEKRDFNTGEVLERESQGSVDNNWTVFPEFGDYLYLCKEER